MFRSAAIILAIMALTFLSGPWGPWWMIAPLAAIICFLVRSQPMLAFFQGMAAGFLLWGGLAFFHDQANDHILSSQIGALFQGLSPLVIVLLTGLIGGLAGGFGALTGANLREVFQDRKKQV